MDAPNEWEYNALIAQSASTWDESYKLVIVWCIQNVTMACHVTLKQNQDSYHCFYEWTILFIIPLKNK